MATRWSPDTCECVIEYDMEGEEIVNVVAIKTCMLHADLAGHELGKRVLDRNRDKNYVHAELIGMGAKVGELQVRYDQDDAEQLLVTGHDLKLADVKARLAKKFPGKRIKVV